MFITYGNPQKDTAIKKIALFQKVTQEFKAFPFSALADKHLVKTDVAFCMYQPRNSRLFLYLAYPLLHVESYFLPFHKWNLLNKLCSYVTCHQKQT